MTKCRLSKQYDDEVQFFLKFAVENGIDLNLISHPHTKCENFRKVKDVVEVKDHLNRNGIDILYKN